MPIQLKRSSSTAVPPTLANGEPAFTAAGNVLFIGVDGQVLPVAGERNPGVLTPNQAIVTDSSNFINNINVSNSIFISNNGTSLSISAPSTGSRIFSNSSLDIFSNNYIKLHSNPNTAVGSGTAQDSNWVIVSDQGIYIQSFDEAGTTLADITIEAGGIKTIGDIISFFPNTYSLGNSSFTWRNVYVGNSVVVGTTSLNTSGLAIGSAITANTTRLTLGSTAGIQANGTVGSAGQVLTSNASSVYWSTPTTGTITTVNTGNGLVGGPITSIGTVSVLANSGIVANNTGVFVNTAFIGTLTSNNSTNFGGLSLATVQGQITGNAAVAYTNAVTFVTTQLYANTSQLNANVVTLQSQITSNAATAYTNAIAYVVLRDFANVTQLNSESLVLRSLITGNAATAYTNAVSYVNSRPFVNTSQLASNLALYAQLSGAVFTGSVTTNNLTVTGNLVLQGNTVIVAANNLVVNDAVISLHSPANGSALTSDDGRNIGISFHYYDTEDRHGALLRDNSTGRLTWYSDATDPNIGNNVTGTVLGTIQANTFYAGNSTVFATVNSTSYTGTANNSTNFGGLSLATVQGQITSNAATAYTNAVAYVDSKSFVNTAQLSANVSTIQGQITSNAATAYTNAVAYVDSKSFANTSQLNANVVTLQGQITSNAAAAYSNAVLYVDGKSFVNTSQLNANVVTLQGQITSNAATAYTNAVAYVTAQSFANTSQLNANVVTLQGQITSNAATAYTNSVSYVTAQSFVNTATLSANVSTLQGQITSNTATAYTNSVSYVDGKSFANTAQLNANVSTLQGQITSNAATAYSNTISYIILRDFANITQLNSESLVLRSLITGNAATAYTNAVAYVNSRPFVNTAQLSGNLALYATIANPTFTGNVTTGNVIINTTGGIRANGSFGTDGQVLTSNGTSVYWSTVTSGGGGFTNGQSISVNNFTLTGAFTANSSNGSAGQILISNGTGVYWGPAPTGGGGTVTQVSTGNGLTGGPITTTGTVAVLANNGITANATGLFVVPGTGVVVNNTGVHVNSTFIGTLSANNASFLGGTAAGSYQLNSTLAANVATLTSNNSTNFGGLSLATVQGQITGNAATAYTNAVAYVDGRPFVNTAQLSANLANYQTTAGLASNVATLTSNNSTNFGGLSLATVQGQIAGNAATAYTNSVSYVASQSFVNTAQLSGNLALYAQLSGAVFTGSVTTNNLTVTGNLVLQGNAVIVGANNLVVNDAVISLHSPANGSPLTSNDGRNIGISFHYYDTEDKHGALIRDNSTGRLTWYADSTDPNIGTDVTGTVLGTIQANTFYAGNSTVFATVNATSYTGTSNNSTNFGGLSLATVQGQITGNAATAFTNATNFASNATNIAAGTLNNARLPAAINVTSVNASALTVDTIVVANTLGITTSANITITSTGELVVSPGAGIFANGSLGTAGQALFSNGTSIYWDTVAAGGGVNTAAQFAWTNTHSFAANVTIASTSELIIAGGAGIQANGSFGTIGQVLTSNGSSIYWANSVSTIVSQQFTANGTANSFTVSGGYIPSAIEVYVSGVKQVPVTDVAISSGATVDFIVAPLDGQVVDVFGYRSVGGITGPRVASVTSASTITPTADTADQYNVTALATGATIATPSGTPADGQRLILRFKDNGTGRALSWTTSSGAYRAIGPTLPTTTVASKTTYVGCVYNAADTFWDVIAVATQA